MGKEYVYIVGACNVVDRLKVQKKYVDTLGDECPLVVLKKLHIELMEALLAVYDEIPHSIAESIDGYDIEVSVDVIRVIPRETSNGSKRRKNK